jgi:cell volume regulation protein A
VFFVVLTSVLIQGTTVSTAARLFKVDCDTPVITGRSHELMISENAAHNIHEVDIDERSPAVGRALFELGLPSGVLIALLYRDNTVHVPQGGTVPRAGDVVMLVAENDDDYARARFLLGGND